MSPQLSTDGWQQEMRLRFTARSIQYHSLLRYHLAEWQHCQVQPCVDDRWVITLGAPIADSRKESQ